MFGLTFEKLLLVMIVAGVLVGPRRLPHYAQELARLVRSFRDFVDATRVQAEREMGMSLQPTEWKQYDPRRIMREAMQDPMGTTTGPEEFDPRVDEALRVRPGQKYLVTGSAAHPQRILLQSLPSDDPRRLAAQVDSVADVAVGDAVDE